MFRRRSYIDVIARILEKAREPTLKTHLGYAARVTLTRVGRYIELMVSRGLLEREGNSYRATEKGERFLELYAELRGMLE